MPSSRPSRRFLPLIAALAVALAAAGCGGGSSDAAPPSTSAASGTRPTTHATLQIVQPTANEVTGPDVKLVLKLTGAQVVPRTSGPLSGDKGHIHVSVDGKLVSMAFQTSDELTGLTPGPHTVQAEFVAVDHAPFRNRVVASVLFTVKA